MFSALKYISGICDWGLQGREMGGRSLTADERGRTRIGWFGQNGGGIGRVWRGAGGYGGGKTLDEDPAALSYVLIPFGLDEIGFVSHFLKREFPSR